MEYQIKIPSSNKLTIPKIICKNEPETKTCLEKKMNEKEYKYEKNRQQTNRIWSCALKKRRHTLGHCTQCIESESRKPGARRVTDGGQTAGLLLHNNPKRRESFLYRSESDVDTSTRSSRNQSIGGDSSTGIPEEPFITPFAQILSRLKKIRSNFKSLIDAMCNKEKDPDILSEKDDIIRRVSPITLEELDWCLGQLEAIQTGESVSELASTKFKKMLSKELSSCDDKDQSNRQVSDYIFKTFVQNKEDRSFSLNTNPLLNVRSMKNSEIEKAEKMMYRFIKIPQQNIIEEYFNNHLGEWNIDIFFVNDLTMGQPLTFTSYYIFKAHNFFHIFNIPLDKFITLMRAIEQKYNSVTPYHNNIHAADVVHTTHVLLERETLKNVFTPREIFALLLSCIIHDTDHPGVTNQFLINTNDRLALVYNDISVLENHHLAVAFKLFFQEDCNIFSSFDSSEMQKMRRLMIDMVLATDMSKHMSLLGDLKTLVETKKISYSGLINMDNYCERIQVLQVMIHCSDLSNPTKDRKLYEKWVQLIMEEFFLQGDKEKNLGIEISPMCDREEANIAMSQVRFMDYIVHPLWETWADLVYPDCQFIIDRLKANRDYYEAQVNCSKKQ